MFLEEVGITNVSLYNSVDKRTSTTYTSDQAERGTSL